MSGSLLLHVCCAPCAIVPLEALRAEGFNPEGFFYNPNIHPSREYRRRLEALTAWAATQAFPVHAAGGYHPEEHLRATLGLCGEPATRCGVCYDLRLERAAREALERGFPAFSSTLLVSPYQCHEEIRRAGERAASTAGGVAFIYRDFRPGYRRGVTVSRELGMYRQPYCGCLWSEGERYERGRS